MTKRKPVYDLQICRKCGENGVLLSGMKRYQWYRIDDHTLRCAKCGDDRKDGLGDMYGGIMGFWRFYAEWVDSRENATR